MVYEVGRRPDNRHAQIGADPDGDHILVNMLARADACVVMFCDDVGEPVVDCDLDFDVRVLGSSLASAGRMAFGRRARSR